MKRGLRDGLVKSTIDGLNPPFEQLYIDSWVTVDYFRYKKQNKKIPQKIDYLKRTVFKKVVSDLVILETTRKIKERFKIILSEKDWKEFFQELNVNNIGNPLNLSASTPDEFDDAHIKNARNLQNCIIMTWDSNLLKKAPDIAWSYGKIRQIHSNT